MPPAPEEAEESPAPLSITSPRGRAPRPTLHGGGLCAQIFRLFARRVLIYQPVPGRHRPASTSAKPLPISPPTTISQCLCNEHSYLKHTDGQTNDTKRRYFWFKRIILSLKRKRALALGGERPRFGSRIRTDPASGSYRDMATLTAPSSASHRAHPEGGRQPQSAQSIPGSARCGRI